MDGRGDVAVEIPGSGVWRYEDATAWPQLTPADASQVSIAGDGVVAVDIPGFGVLALRGRHRLDAADPGPTPPRWT